VVRWRSG